MIGNIEENQSLILNNVLTFRGKLNQQESISISKEIDDILEKNNAKKVGGTVTVTHNISVENGVQIIDLEIMLPLDKEITVSEPFTFMPEFALNDALRIRIEGNPQQMQTAIQTLAEYIESKNLQPNTPLYAVTIKEAKTAFDVEDMITDLYTGIESV